MRRTLLKFAPLYSRHFLSPPPTSNPNPIFSLLPLSSTPSRFRFFSSENDDSSTPPPPPPPPETTTETSVTEPEKKEVSPNIPDVDTKEFKRMINLYMKGNEDMLPAITEAILARRLSGKHEETDSEIMEELEFQPLNDVKDKEFESDFEDIYETDEEIENLYNARQIVEKRMAKDEYFNMDDKKWDEMIKEGVEHGFLKDTKECEEILEDMLNWDKLLPDEIKAKVEARFNELGDMVERKELDVQEAFRLFKEFEDKMVLECAKMMEAEQPPLDELTTVPDKSTNLDDPPGEGPILRWQTRVVFAPGGDAWHPKNRKVKLSVTVKELELSKHAYRRLRELVGKRYHPGKDELTITSERFEHREENRKDCLRTLYSLIAEAMKADKIVEETRVSYVKEKLKKNKEFMKRLKAKNLGKCGSRVAIPS
ncbi:Ribosomal protein S24/S35 [Macleaya cordata]|uniref:Ribosomal protein S24/S35 n=1 Tax=Macleaya cordata TaxID=56857 RepID=A0A200PNU8_MACCD|nr:Ribosomal protein S24/S35 [Macleaya cordata]